jgi:hypothetical protein
VLRAAAVGRLYRVNPAVHRAAATILAATAAVVGGYAEFAPRSFYDQFPLSSHPWIAPIGPYNEHLVRDVGSAYLALCVLSLWVLVRRTREMSLVAGSVWSAFSLPHFVFHLFHLDEFGTADKIGNIVALGGSAVLALVLLAPERQPRSAQPEAVR